MTSSFGCVSSMKFLLQVLFFGYVCRILTSILCFCLESEIKDSHVGYGAFFPYPFVHFLLRNS